jgi:very-short-patch-repair endonuclease
MDSHEYYFIGEFADLIGVTPSVLIRWEREGKLTPSYRDEKGYRRYSKQQLADILNIDVSELKIKKNHFLQCWECGTLVPRSRKIAYYRVMCEDCRKEYEIKKEEILNEYIKLKKEVMFERALRIIEKSETANMCEIEEAAKAIKEYSQQNLNAFDSSHEMVAAIMLLNCRTRLKFQYEVASKRIDIYLPDWNCGVEIDGVFHKGTELKDSKRDMIIRKEMGEQFEIIRIPTKYIEKNPMKVPEYIKKAYKHKKELRRKHHGILPGNYSEREKQLYKKILK